jgi:hypothetical protein
MVRHSHGILPVLIAAFVSILCSQDRPGTVQETQRKLWLDLKKALTASDGREYFRLNVLDAGIPGGTYGLRWLTGTIVSSEVVGTAQTIAVAMSDNDTPEVTLKISRLSPVDLRIGNGTVVEFEGVGVAFTPSPFMLALEASVCKRPANDAPLRCELE